MVDIYKLVIVDDEELVRVGLRQGIDWEVHSIKIVGEASDGKEALQIIKNCQPDIILSDVKMPGISGIELAEKVKEIAPKSMVILLSGYDEFDFVQAAIRNKVFEYILKPSSKEKIIEVVLRAVEQIKKENNRLENEDELKKRLEEGIPVIKERCMENILLNNDTLEKICEEFSYIQFNICEGNAFVIVLELKFTNEAMENYRKKLLILSYKINLMNTLSDMHKGEVLQMLDNKIVIILNINRSDVNGESVDTILTIGEKLLAVLSSSEVLVTMGISKVHNTKYLYKAYEEATEAIEHKVFYGEGGVFFYGDIVKEKSRYFFYPYDIENDILMALKIGDKGKVYSKVEDFISYFITNKDSSPKEFKNSALQLVYVLLRKLIEWGYNFNISLDGEESIDHMIKTSDSKEEIEKIIKGQLNYIVLHINDERTKEINQSIASALKFTEDNFQNNITVKDIAEAVYLSPGHFSKLFKKEMGKTVLEFITELRMKKAKEIIYMEKNITNNELAERVGYKDVKYFTKKFQEYYQLTPGKVKKL